MVSSKKANTDISTYITYLCKHSMLNQKDVEVVAKGDLANLTGKYFNDNNKEILIHMMISEGKTLPIMYHKCKLGTTIFNISSELLRKLSSDLSIITLDESLKLIVAQDMLKMVGYNPESIQRISQDIPKLNNLIRIINSGHFYQLISLECSLDDIENTCQSNNNKFNNLIKAIDNGKADKLLQDSRYDLLRVLNITNYDEHIKRIEKKQALKQKK